MYQTNTTNTEIDFNSLIKVFKSTISALPVEADDSEWNMKAVYTPNHACIWNKIPNIGRECGILEKNSEFAVVSFLNVKHTDLPANIYRLEDLTFIREGINLQAHPLKD